MSALNNKKGMLTTSILGLFLTAAMPLSFSVITTPTAMAGENSDLSVEDLNNKISGFSSKIEKPQIISFNKFDEEVVKKATFNHPEIGEPKEKSTFSLGHALHELGIVADKVGEKKFINGKVLAELAKHNPKLQEQIATDATEKLYEYFMYTVQYFANNTDTVKVTAAKIALNLEFTKRLNNVLTVLLAYQNLYTIQLQDNQNKLSALEKECQKEYQALEFGETGDAGKAKEKADLKAKYDKEKSNLDQQITGTEKSKENTKSINQLSTLNDTINSLNEKLKKLEEDYDLKIQAIDEVLAAKMTENKRKIEEFTQSNQESADKTKSYLSYFFDELGAWSGKSIGRWLQGLAVRREDHNFSGVDVMLAKYPQALHDAKSLMYSKILEGAEKYYSEIENYPKEVVLASLLNHLGYTQETSAESQTTTESFPNGEQPQQEPEANSSHTTTIEPQPRAEAVSETTEMAPEDTTTQKQIESKKVESAASEQSAASNGSKTTAQAPTKPTGNGKNKSGTLVVKNGSKKKGNRNS